MNFPGGSTTIPKPTRAALIESAKAWTILAYETAETITLAETDRHRVERKLKAQLERVELILKELAEMEKP